MPWVRAECGGVGFVIRVARGKEWADVKWSSNGVEWSKRMPTESLTVLHTIPMLGGEMTDLTRKKELSDGPS